MSDKFKLVILFGPKYNTGSKLSVHCPSDIDCIKIDNICNAGLITSDDLELLKGKIDYYTHFFIGAHGSNSCYGAHAITLFEGGKCTTFALSLLQGINENQPIHVTLFSCYSYHASMLQSDVLPGSTLITNTYPYSEDLPIAHFNMTSIISQEKELTAADLFLRYIRVSPAPLQFKILIAKGEEKIFFHDPVQVKSVEDLIDVEENFIKFCINTPECIITNSGSPITSEIWLNLNSELQRVETAKWKMQWESEASNIWTQLFQNQPLAKTQSLSQVLNFASMPIKTAAHFARLPYDKLIWLSKEGVDFSKMHLYLFPSYELDWDFRLDIRLITKENFEFLLKQGATINLCNDEGRSLLGAEKVEIVCQAHPIGFSGEALQDQDTLSHNHM